MNKLKSVLISTFYKLFKIKIEKNLWIFSSSFNTKFNYNSKYLFEYILKNKKNIKVRYVINDDNLRERLRKKYGDYFIETKTIKGIREVLKAGVWFTSAGMPVYGFYLNKKRKIINLWHGVPLKKIAMMSDETSLASKLFFKILFSNNYSYILTPSKNLVQIMSESFLVNTDKIKVLGQPRNDLIFKKNNDYFLENYKITKVERKILYAPTYRENKKTILFPFKDYDIKVLNTYLEKNNIYIYIRMHQSEIDDGKIFETERVVFLNEDKVEDIMEIINQFDLLITDYSSIYIDYLLTEKPILFIPYDYNEYFKKRGFNFEYNQVTPGPKIKTQKEFECEILKLLNDKTYFVNERKKVKNYFNEVQEECCEKIYNFILKEGD